MGRAGADAFVLPVEADDMVGTGKENARHPVAMGRLVEIVQPHDIGIEDVVEPVFGRNAAQMQDAIATGHNPLHRLAVAQIAADELCAAGQFAGIGNICQPKGSGDMAQAVAHITADPASSPGDQQFVQHGHRV